MTISEERLRDLIDNAHGCACAHGFHERKVSVEHCVMLMLTEVSEAVEADRKGLHADLHKFDRIMKYADDGDKSFCDVFVNFVKDTFEDELADVCIRMFDTCGEFSILPKVSEDMSKEFGEIFGQHSTCEKCFYLSQLLCMVDERCNPMDEGDDESLVNVLTYALAFVLEMCEDMGIDIMRHIELKMRYNEGRPLKNGKEY